MTRLLYIIAIIFLIGWLIRIAFPYILKFFLWLISRKIEKGYGQAYNQEEKTVEYKAKEKRNKDDDGDEFIEYEEVE